MNTEQVAPVPGARYQLQPAPPASALEQNRQRAMHLLRGPAEPPSQSSKLTVTALCVLIAMVLTKIEADATGQVWMEFYLLACVVATWYGGLGMGLLAVVTVSVLQFAGPLTSFGHWEFNR